MLVCLVTIVLHSSEGLECVPPQHSSALSVEVIQKKCPLYNGEAIPKFHIAQTCDGSDPTDLAFALANHGFLDCSKWCVFSMSAPTEVSWMWQPTGTCWHPSQDCLGFKMEQDHAIAVKNSLCLEPKCKVPTHHSLLSVEHIRLKCEGYDVNHSPAYHHRQLCNSDTEDISLKTALVNFNFASCSAWCVFSIESPTTKAWKWNVIDICWTESADCFNFDSEKTKAEEVAATFCQKSSVSKPSSAENTAEAPQQAVMETETQTQKPETEALVTPETPESTNQAEPQQTTEQQQQAEPAQTTAQTEQTAEPQTAEPQTAEPQTAEQTAPLQPARENVITHFTGCTPFVSASALDINRVRTRCPDYDPSKGPHLHRAKLCTSQAEDTELAKALVNFAYTTCSSWCVFSTSNPSSQAWKWNPRAQCWDASSQCLTLAEEVRYSSDLANSLCLETPTPTPSPSSPFQLSREKLEEQRRAAQRLVEAREKDAVRIRSQHYNNGELSPLPEKKAQPTAPSEHFRARARRSKDPIEEGYKIFGGLLFIMSGLAALFICRRDSILASKRK